MARNQTYAIGDGWKAILAEVGIDHADVLLVGGEESTLVKLFGARALARGAQLVDWRSCHFIQNSRCNPSCEW